MSNEQVTIFDLGAEVDRYFDDSSVPRDEPPRIVLLTGPIASGKTTIRKQQYATGYVVVDAVEIFLSLSRGEFYPFPGPFVEPLNMIGGLVACRAVSELRHIVTELVGLELEATQSLIDAMHAVGYSVSVVSITCDIDVGWQRNVNRGDNDISCYYAEPFQRRWLLEAATLAPGVPKTMADSNR